MQISKETAKLQKLIAEYNSCHCDEPDLILADVLEPHSTDVGRKERHDIIQAYLRKKRSEEEIKLLLAEVEKNKQYFQEKLRLVISRCRYINACDLFNLGSHRILTKYLEQCLSITKESVLDSEYYSDESDCDSNCYSTDEGSGCEY